MKNKLPVLLVALFALLSVAAVAPTYTAGPDTLWRAQGDPQFDANGNLTALTVPFFYKATFTNTSDPTDKFDKNLGQVDVDFVKDAAKTVTFIHNGQSYTLPYGAIGTGMVAIGNKEWAAKP